MSRVLVLGMSRSAKTKPTKASTLTRLRSWCEAVNLREWDFHNVIPEIVNGNHHSQVDVDTLARVAFERHKVIALGTFVSSVCRRNKIEHLKIDHPSPRNRNLNSKNYEVQMLQTLRDYLHGTN